MKVFIYLCLLLMPLVRPSVLLAEANEDELYATARRAFDDGFHDVAIQYLEEFVPQFPGSKKLNQAKLLLGQCYFLKNDYAKALAVFESLPRLSEDQDVLLFWLGETQLKLSNHAKARLYYQQLINQFPSSVYMPQALYSLGWSYFDQKEYVKAKETFDTLCNDFPKHQLTEDAMLKKAQSLFNEGDYLNAIKVFEQFVVLYPQNARLADVSLNMADAYYYADYYDKAIEFYDKAIKAGQDAKMVQVAYIGKIWCLIKKKSYDQAQKIIKESMELSKQKNLPVEDLELVTGQLMYEKNDYDAAVAAYGKLISDYPAGSRRLEAYLGMANAYYLLKKYPEAIVNFKYILDHRQPDADGELVEKATLGYAWANIKDNRADEGLKSFEAVIKQASNKESSINAMVQMADAKQDIGHFKEAIAVYDQIMKDFPGNAWADYVLYRQAVAYLKADQIQASLNSFEHLRNTFPNSKYLEDMAYYQGLLAFKKGDWDQASQSMGQFLKNLTRPSDLAPEANYILGLSLLNLKQADEALKVFQKILRLYPEDEIVAKNSDIGIAKCQFELGQTKEAVKRFRLIVFKYPKSDVEEESLLWLAQYAMKNAQYDQAVENYSAIVDRFPGSAQLDQVRYELGQAYEMQGLTDQALNQYKAINANDPILMSKVKLSIAGIFAKEFDASKALVAYQNIADTNPDYARDSYLKMAQLYRNAQNYESEIQMYTKALKVDQAKSAVTNAELFFDLGDVNEVMNRMEEAIENYLKIPAQCADQTAWVVKAYLRVAKIFEDRKDLDGARVTYQKIIQLKTDESKYAQERLDALRKK